MTNAIAPTLLRTDSDHPDFRALILLLDQGLLENYGAAQAYYAQFNKVDLIKQVVVAYVDGQPAGCGAFKPYDGDTAEIKRMFVHPGFRRKGIAVQVLKELESWAKTLDYNQCILETGNQQTAAIALYQTLDYRIIPNYGQYEGLDTSICMLKSI